MPATTKAPLGATTTNRKWYLDVNTGTAAVPVWTGVFGITEFQDTLATGLQDDSDFDGGGWKSEMATSNKWGLAIKVKRAIQDGSTPPVYDAGQEVLRLAAAQVGLDNVVQVRWYEMEPNGPRVEAYSGDAAVQWSPDGGNMEALSTASVTLAGRGTRVVETHPTEVI